MYQIGRKSIKHLYEAFQSGGVVDRQTDLLIYRPAKTTLEKNFNARHCLVLLLHVFNVCHSSVYTVFVYLLVCILAIFLFD